MGPTTNPAGSDGGTAPRPSFSSQLAAESSRCMLIETIKSSRCGSELALLPLEERGVGPDLNQGSSVTREQTDSHGKQCPGVSEKQDKYSAVRCARVPS